jgi:hypothetical protein
MEAVEGATATGTSDGGGTGKFIQAVDAATAFRV